MFEGEDGKNRVLDLYVELPQKEIYSIKELVERLFNTSEEEAHFHLNRGCNTSNRFVNNCEGQVYLGCNSYDLSIELKSDTVSHLLEKRFIFNEGDELKLFISGNGGISYAIHKYH
ncbi:hypothetical protein [Leptospira sarikeiensis]|uniref:Uncharacterized protein n=1 Tax=Leptospira sarikeiensis TaxID=2484943 RepID=A0A4R9KF73_9LEPT|nr:hypothetical protein [Leptospira sarikeiensis]TGL65956.1 hypothetical protein EHQ64_00075 [Leptospira sarikeiensis]